MNNPIHDMIRREIVNPALDKISRESDGFITYVNYVEQTVDITWNDKSSAKLTAKNVSIPQDGNGIYRQAAKVGDRVKIGFINGNHLYPYISIIYKDGSKDSDYRATNGAGIMKGMNYIMGGD